MHFKPRIDFLHGQIRFQTYTAYDIFLIQNEDKEDEPKVVQEEVIEEEEMVPQEH